jgi:hypothetical protein
MGQQAAPADRNIQLDQRQLISCASSTIFQADIKLCPQVFRTYPRARLERKSSITLGDIGDETVVLPKIGANRLKYVPPLQLQKKDPMPKPFQDGAPSQLPSRRLSSISHGEHYATTSSTPS